MKETVKEIFLVLLNNVKPTAIGQDYIIYKVNDHEIVINWNYGIEAAKFKLLSPFDKNALTLNNIITVSNPIYTNMYFSITIRDINYDIELSEDEILEAQLKISKIFKEVQEKNINKTIIEVKTAISESINSALNELF